MWLPLERYGELNASLPGTETFHYAVGHNGADYGAYRALPVDMLVVGGPLPLLLLLLLLFAKVCSYHSMTHTDQKVPIRTAGTTLL